MTRQAREQRTTKDGRPLLAPAVNLREKKRRKPKRQYTDNQVLINLDEVAAVVYAPTTYTMAASVPMPDHGQGGRPADFPIWTYVVYAQLISVFGSARKVHRAMQNALVWDLVVRGATSNLHLDKKALMIIEALPSTGPKRHHWNYWSAVIREHLDTYSDTFRACAIKQATAAGMLNPNDPFNLKNPLRRNTVVGDGKVHDGPSRYIEAMDYDPETGELLRTHRVSPGSDWFKEGGVATGKWVFGSKWVTLSCRADDSWHNRIVLDLAQQTRGGRGGGEAGLGQDMLLRLKNAAPGLQHAVWDGAMRGVHINTCLNAGFSLTAPIHAYRSETGRSHHRKGRTQRDRLLGVFNYTADGSRCRHRLYLINGRAHESTITEDGSVYIQPLAYTAERRTEGKNKAVRWYHVVRIDCPHGDHSARDQHFHEERVPLTRQPTDRAKNFNRAEHLRLVPAGTELFDLLIGWRQDSESFHSQAEYAFHGHRLPAYTDEQQHLILLGLAMRMNAVQRWVAEGHHLPGAPPPEPAAEPAEAVAA